MNAFERYCQDKEAIGQIIKEEDYIHNPASSRVMTRVMRAIDSYYKDIKDNTVNNEVTNAKITDIIKSMEEVLSERVISYKTNMYEYFKETLKYRGMYMHDLRVSQGLDVSPEYYKMRYLEVVEEQRIKNIYKVNEVCDRLRKKTFEKKYIS
jgi:hypothetical protein